MPVYEAISQKRMEEKDSSSWSNGSIKVCDGVTQIENVLKYKPHNCNRGDTYRALITDTSLLLSLSSFPPPWSRGLIYPSPFVTASFIPCHSLTNSALFLLFSSFLHHLLPIVTIHLLSPLPLLFTVLSPCHLCGIVFKMASGLLQTRGITICVCVCARVCEYGCVGVTRISSCQPGWTLLLSQMPVTLTFFQQADLMPRTNTCKQSQMTDGQSMLGNMAVCRGNVIVLHHL